MEDGEDKEEVITNTRLLSYDIKVGVAVGNKVRMLAYSDKPCLNVVCANLIACLRKKQLLVYSRNRSGLKSKKKSITPKRVMNAISFLEEEGYIDHTKGVGHIRIEKRKISFISPTQKFIDLFEIEHLMQECEKVYAESYPVVELRNQNKESIVYRSSKEIVAMENLVKKLNEINEKAVICDAHGNNMTNMYCRIFNESFEFGGRFYKADVLRLKHKKKE